MPHPDDYQIEIPPSFMALYLDPRSGKPNAPRDAVASRYDLCEDMANLLTETAQSMLLGLGITEADVLQRIARGLAGDAAVLTPQESVWVLRRLAELLQWPH